MIVFINERSLEPHSNWGAALRLFWEASNALAGHSERYRDSQFFEGSEFRQRFQLALAGTAPDLRAIIREVVFSERYWQCWRSKRLSAPDEMFVCEQPDVLVDDESLCEAAENKLSEQHDMVGVVSAADSVFASSVQLSLVKHSTQQRAELQNASTVSAVVSWTVNNRDYYDPQSRVAPSDFQTILTKDQARFNRTNRCWKVADKERRMYEELATGNYYYVDEGHPGHSAHLEVFDRNGNHVGEADINTGIVDTSKRDDAKTIVL